MIIVDLLQALQGDRAWAQFLIERGYGKVAEKIEGGTSPIQDTFTLKIDNVYVHPKLYASRRCRFRLPSKATIERIRLICQFIFAVCR